LDTLWEKYGKFVIPFSMKTGWDEVLRALGYDLKGFLDSLDAMHYFIDHIVYPMNLRGPSFRCVLQDDGSLLLHYYSSRTGFPGIVKGIVHEVSQRIFGIEVEMTIEKRRQEHISSIVKEHIIFSITEVFPSRFFFASRQLRAFKMCKTD
uniref:HNOB domain-containing protein n=1 Tax=Gongylonema pulchrum TaxID=637853 RepID=A0A183DC75_9BILA